MGVDIIYDPGRQVAVLACNTSDIAFGPIIHDRDGGENYLTAEEMASLFLKWLPCDPRIAQDIDGDYCKFLGYVEEFYDKEVCEGCHEWHRGMRPNKIYRTQVPGMFNNGKRLAITRYCDECFADFMGHEYAAVRVSDKPTRMVKVKASNGEVLFRLDKQTLSKCFADIGEIAKKRKEAQ